jgi:hypothetical protein
LTVGVDESAEAVGASMVGVDIDDYESRLCASPDGDVVVGVPVPPASDVGAFCGGDVEAACDGRVLTRGVTVGLVA